MTTGAPDPKVLRRKSAAGIAATLLAVALVVGLIRWFQSPSDATPEGPAHRAVREELDAKAAERLEGYGWIDKEKGIVHIPVERAIELMLREARLEGERDG